MPRIKVSENNENPDVFWMIRDKTTGLFYVGTYWKPFKKKGKLLYSQRNLATALKKLRGMGHNMTLLEVIQYKRVVLATCEANGYGT